MIWNCLILYILWGLMLRPFTVICAAFIAGSKVNCHHRNDPSSPWGGFGQSGIGRENGPEAFEEYTTTKSLTIRTRPKVWTFWTRIMSMHVNATLANVGTFRIRYSQTIVKRRARTHTSAVDTQLLYLFNSFQSFSSISSSLSISDSDIELAGEFLLCMQDEWNGRELVWKQICPLRLRKATTFESLEPAICPSGKMHAIREWGDTGLVLKPRFLFSPWCSSNLPMTCD